MIVSFLGGGTVSGTGWGSAAGGGGGAGPKASATAKVNVAGGNREVLGRGLWGWWLGGVVGLVGMGVLRSFLCIVLVGRCPV